jgi:PAS domain S-box-containing protein
MKYSVQPTTIEKVMREDDFIVSKTDVKGRITYANRIFMEYSGFTEQELLGAPHNIIRHPDMPRGVFKLLWDTVQSGNEICAYVKNMSRDGSFYWVFANVSPVRDAEEKIIGFYSVRRKPKKEALDKIVPLYKEMLEAEQKAGTKDAISASLSIATDALLSVGVQYDEFILSL